MEILPVAVYYSYISASVIVEGHATVLSEEPFSSNKM